MRQALVRNDTESVAGGLDEHAQGRAKVAFVELGKIQQAALVAQFALCAFFALDLVAPPFRDILDGPSK
jgi:hypothetical protein